MVLCEINVFNFSLCFSGGMTILQEHLHLIPFLSGGFCRFLLFLFSYSLSFDNLAQRVGLENGERVLFLQ